MRRVLRVKPRQPLEEAPTPGLSPSPLTEGAEAPIAGPYGPQLRLRDLVGWALHLDSETQSAIADVLREIERLRVHRQSLADGCVVPPVFTERL